jgi:hypothetical protein
MGVELEYAAFPHGLYWDIMDQALRDHPDPDPPMVEIEVLDGTEMMPDEEDGDYLAGLAEAQRKRYNVLREAALDLCVRPKGGLEQHEPEIVKAAKYIRDEPPPEDPEERRFWWLKRLAIRTAEDARIVLKVQTFSQIEDEEVSRKAESFPGDVEGPEGA